MKVAVLVNSNPKNKTGYFNAAHQRIKNLQSHCTVYVFVIKHYDSRLLSFFERARGKKTFDKIEQPFEYDSVVYSELWIKRDFISALLFRLNFPVLAWKHAVKISCLPHELRDSDVISAHWGYPHGCIATILADKFNKLSAVTYHGSDIHSLKKSPDRYALQCTQHTLVNADVNIFVSQALEEFALNNICNNKAKTVVLYNAIDFATFPKTVKSSSSNTVVGFVGNLKLVKRAEKLPDIFQQINALNPKVSFIVVGDGVLRNKIEQECIDLKLPVTFTGMVNPSEIPNIMCQFDLLILPSRNEGLPMVLIEALSMGVKAIGTDVGGIKEVLGAEYVVVEGQYFEKRFAQKASDVLACNRIPMLDPKFINNTDRSDELDIYKRLLITKK